MTEPITNLPDAVAAMGALPMPVGSEPGVVERLLADAVRLAGESVAELKREHEISGELRQYLDEVHESLTGANLSLYEEELENARLRLALKSAQRGRRRLRARVAELEAERAGVVAEINRFGFYGSALPVAKALVKRASELVTENAALKAERHTTNEALSDAAERMRADRDRIAELEALKPAAIQTCQKCGAGYTYGEPCAVCLLQVRIDAERAKRDDLARCLGVHSFSPRDGWRMVCGSCDHGKDADCHEAGGRRV